MCLITSAAAAQERQAAEPAYVVVTRAPAMADALREAFEASWRDRGHSLVEPPPPPQLRVPDPALLASARRAFTELRPREAVLALQDFVADVDASGGGVTRQEWLEALLLLARARLALGENARADEAFDRVLTMAPELALDPASYPPPFRAAFDARRSALGSPSRLRLLLVGAPPELRISVDGAASSTPSELPELMPGVHLLRLFAPHRYPRAVRIELDEAHRQLSAALRPDPFAALRAQAAAASARELRAATALLGAVPLLLEAQALPRARLRVTVWDGASDRRAAFLAAADASPAELVRRALAALDRVANVPARRRRRRILGWTLGSALVAGAAAALAVALSDRHQHGFRLSLESGAGAP